MSIYFIGTSGFSYDDWRGFFYPENFRTQDFLSFYSKHFKTTEVNSTYYRIPNTRVVESMVKKVPEGFIFSVKANQVFTHQREFLKKDVERMKDVLKAFDGKLGPLLFQFPHSFHKRNENIDYISKIRDIFHEFELAFEFRSYEWFSTDVLDNLSKLEVTFVCVDEPRIKGLIPPVAVATNPRIFYVRFHGRNTEKWYEHKRPEERYDYLYSEQELENWAEKIRGIETEKKFIYFNNHPRAQAVINAKMMEKLL